VRIAVAGTVAGVPGQGGAVWAVLQYALGLRRLGHEVVLVEPVDRIADAAPVLAGIVRPLGLDAALVERTSGRLWGSGAQRLRDGVDMLLNLSGVLTDQRLLTRADRRVFVDLDPGFTQLWHAAEGIDLGLEHHDAFVTVGGAIGSPGCAVPDCGRAWVTTPQPVVLEHWPRAGSAAGRAVTTVGHWRSYGSITHDGVFYGQRAHSMRLLLPLPGLTTAMLRPALAIHPDERNDLAALRAHGWRLTDPGRVAGAPDAYRSFVQGSWAELGIAKLGYVVSRCGWFSDRSVCYLASGRPVIAQDTGFSDWLATGSGVLSYQTAEQAAAALDELRTEYRRHSRAARRLAEDVFDSDRVLTRLLACL
jgi:hypothetical protein